MKRYNIRPSKNVSLLSVVVGIVFVLIGITTIVPIFGAFGMLWMLIAVAITGYHLKNLLADKGGGIYSIDVEDDEMVTKSNSMNFEAKLRRLHTLYEDNIISRDEYDKKKEEILSSKW